MYGYVAMGVVCGGLYYLKQQISKNIKTMNHIRDCLKSQDLQSKLSQNKCLFLSCKFDYNLSTIDFKKNNFTLINFWASWCSPCRVEHPILMSLSKSKKLKLVGINYKDKKNNAKKFLKELGNPYNLVAKDEIGKKSVNFGIYGIPESILVNKEMIVIKKFIGPLNTQDYNEILKIIN